MIFIVSLLGLIWRWKRLGFDCRNNAIIIMTAAIIFAFISSEDGFSRHFRYVLPVLPLLFVWSSYIAMSPNQVFQILAFFFCGLSIISSLLVFLHSLSYFNYVSGTPLKWPKYLLDSNIDWGQDLLYLKKWQKEHPYSKPLFVRYFGTVDPQWIGLEYKNFEYKSLNGNKILDIKSGWYAISVNDLYEYKHWEYEIPLHHYFLSFDPVATAGYSIYIYYITPSEASRVRREMGLPEMEEIAQE
ncbi:MAG: hypothetical protein LBJ67_04665 [Planctomycetaceae bacterium]|nr:hypothetical protein [Planctomycetaceae bacterium]